MSIRDNSKPYIVAFSDVGNIINSTVNSIDKSIKITQSEKNKTLDIIKDVKQFADSIVDLFIAKDVSTIPNVLHNFTNVVKDISVPTIRTADDDIINPITKPYVDLNPHLVEYDKRWDYMMTEYNTDLATQRKDVSIIGVEPQRLPILTVSRPVNVEPIKPDNSSNNTNTNPIIGGSQPIRPDKGSSSMFVNSQMTRGLTYDPRAYSGIRFLNVVKP